MNTCTRRQIHKNATNITSNHRPQSRQHSDSDNRQSSCSSQGHSEHL